MEGLRHWADELVASSDDTELDKTKKALEAAFKRLKIVEGWNDEARIDHLSAEGLQADIGNIIKDLIVYGKILRPRLEELSRDGNPKTDLLRLKNAAIALIEAIEGQRVKALSLSATAENKLFGSITQSHEQIAMLEKIIAVSNLAVKDAPASRGRPKKKIEQMIAFDLSRYYVELTGTMPNESENFGSLHDLVSNVYDALGINADVMAQIRLAISRRSERYDDYAKDSD